MILDGDFIGFSYGNYHSRDLGIIRVSSNSRYTENLSAAIENKTVTMDNRDGSIYFGSVFKEYAFDLNIAFDSMTESQFRKLRSVFSDKTPQKLIFDERPYKYYLVKLHSPLSLQYICFFENGHRVYKGEGTIPLTSFYPHGFCKKKFLDEYSNDNKNEWKESSGLAESKYIINEDNEVISYDTLIAHGDNYKICLYNPGDFETDFILDITFDSFNENDEFKIYLDEEASRKINFNYIKKEITDVNTNLQYNTASNLLSGYTFGADNTTKIFDGKLYNSFKKNGIFFKIPIGESTLYLSGLKQGLTEDNIKISYNYLYY